MKKKLLIASAITLSTLGIAGSAMAARDTGDTMREDLASKLAERFNLNKDEVSNFMQEQHEARHAEMESKVSESLKAAGFSDEQINALQTKKQEQRTELQAWHEANPDATAEERQAHRKSEKTEFEAWATEQGIDLEKVRSTLKDSDIGRGMHRGPRGNF
jgi:predicted house-cleaning noncanonical NTP pyrophosphatase (MazG superfamily)